MKMTLLEMVQNIMSDGLDSFNINSLNDTEEALQVAGIIKTTYYKLIESRDWSFLERYERLTALGDLTQPSKMKLPTDVYKVDWIQYNKETDTSTDDDFVDLVYLSPEDFLMMTDERSEADSDVDKVTDSDTNLVIKIKNDKMPEFWTSFDDNNIWMDSYDSSEQDSLTAARTRAKVFIEPSWTLSDSFVPTLPSRLFNVLLEQSRSRAVFSLRQTTDALADRDARIAYFKAINKEHRVGGGRTFRNWGRK